MIFTRLFFSPVLCSLLNLYSSKIILFELCVFDLKNRMGQGGREEKTGIIPFETWQNWPSRSLWYQMMKNLRSVKRLSQHVTMICITWIPTIPRNQVCQQCRRISINSHTYWKKSCYSFFTPSFTLNKTETLCHIVGQERGRIWNFTMPSTLSYISNNIFF